MAFHLEQFLTQLHRNDIESGGGASRAAPTNRGCGGLTTATICRRIYRFLTSVRHKHNEDARIGGVKVLIGSIPYSFNYIRELVQRRDYPSFSEVHFSLFCFAADVQYVRKAGKYRRKLVDLIKSYLMDTQRNKRYAMWMASHALGSHLPYRYALDALMDVAEKARYADARIVALEGLHDAYERALMRERREILLKMQNASKNDPSKRVRAAAVAELAKVRNQWPQFLDSLVAEDIMLP